MNNNFTFTPTGKDSSGIQVPFFEDCRADYAPHYRTDRSIEQAQSAVIIELAKLGGASGWFQEGVFGIGKAKRHGYILHFRYGDAAGIIRVAGLPLKGSETPTKLRTVRVQALLNVRDWLKSAITSQVFSPGSEPLMGHLLVDGTRTVADYIAEGRGLPRMNALPDGVVDGEFEAV